MIRAKKVSPVASLLGAVVAAGAFMLGASLANGDYSTMFESPELFGVVVSLVSVLAAVAFMMLSFHIAQRRDWLVLLVYLRLAGGLAIASWVVLISVLFRCDRLNVGVATCPPESGMPSTSLVLRQLTTRPGVASKISDPGNILTSMTR